MYITDGQNERVRIVRRDHHDGADLVRPRRTPAERILRVHSIAVDSKGNIYTTETYEGKRVQKFNFQGIGKVRAGDQGVVWPTRSLESVALTFTRRHCRALTRQFHPAKKMDPRVKPAGDEQRVVSLVRTGVRVGPGGVRRGISFMCPVRRRKHEQERRMRT